MKYSVQQENFFKAIRNTNDSILLVATAGSGKTTTGVASLNMIDPRLSVAFVAFNKSIAEELQRRAPANVVASTLNSMGFSAVRNTFKVTVDGFKVNNIVRNIGCSSDMTAAVVRLVSLGKGTGQRNPDFEALADYYGVVLNGDYDETMKVTRMVYARSLQQTAIIDFDDQILFPALGMCSCKKYDVIMIDEAQDLNTAQIMLIQKSLKAGGRVIAIGDPNQAIYSFRGADAKAIETLTATFNMVKMPLSTTYRCAKNIVKFAQEIVPEIQAWENAPDGELIFQKDADMMKVLTAGDMVLCRTNAPLVHTCLALIRNGIKATIKGRDIGKSVASLINKVNRRYQTSDLVSFLRAMNMYCVAEVAKLLAEDKTGAASTLQDQCDTVSALSDGCTSTQEVLNRIDQIFSDGTSEILLSSIHRAKGLEADRVFIIRPDLLPHPMAKTADAREQEQHLIFVARTRAKTYLSIVSGGK